VGGRDYALVVTADGTRYRLGPTEASSRTFQRAVFIGREKPRLVGDDDGDSVLCPLIVFRLPTAGIITSSLGMLTKWRQSTRLVTRTKESNMYASIRVANPGCAMKVRKA